MRLRRGPALLLAFAATTSFLAACGGGSDTEDAAGGTSIVVGSLATPEGELLAHIYGGALERAGADVHYRLDLGGETSARLALGAGDVDLVPLSLSVLAGAPDGGATLEQALDSARAVASGQGLIIGAPAEASVGDALVVTKVLSNEKGIVRTSDLSKLGAFSLADAVGSKAQLESADPVVGRFAASDPDLAPAGKLVVLEDDAHLLPPGNIVPILRSAKATKGVLRTLAGVGKALTVEEVHALNKKVAAKTATPEHAAEEFLLAE